ncbi:hypothetical protein FACS189494_02230 [Spirochaetia bacterium]|nr:hypothetical protein FACS189494_02230 [Spirochaetia bacterium]
MKRTVLSISFIFAAAAVFSFDLPLSAGLGGAFGFNFNTLQSETDGGVYQQPWSSAAAGGLIFFDANYIKLDFKFYGVSTTIKSNPVLSQFTAVDQDYELAGTGLGISLFGKFPFQVTPAWKIYPTLGVQFDICMGLHFAKDYTPYRNTKKGDSFVSPASWNAVSLKAGIGADFEFTSNVFIRGELLFDFRFPSPQDTAYIKALAMGGQQNPSNLNMGFSFNLAFGYHFATPNIGGGSSRGGGSRGSRRPSGNDIYYPK